MGWKGAGHGLGKDQQGITKPIEVDHIKERSGIGHHVSYDEYLSNMMEIDTWVNPADDLTTKVTETKQQHVPIIHQGNNKPAQKRFRQDFRLNIQKLLKNFISSVSEQDLVFEKGLTSEERAVIHKEAGRYGLKTRSQGTGENRFLVAQKKRTAGELMESIKKNGGQFSKYELVSKGDL